MPTSSNEFSEYEEASSLKNESFSTTNWSVVLEAGQADPARALIALERLCGKYWYPIYAFLRRRGLNQHDAQDLTQSFFEHLLEKEVVKKVDRQKGKFRSFLLAGVTNFLTNDWNKNHALKRGGHQQIISLDETTAEDFYRHEPVEPGNPQKLFERSWAIKVIEQSLARLKGEYAATGKAQLFAKLESVLMQEITPGQAAQWALELDMSPGSVTVALHRMRRRFRELLRSEVAHTVSHPDEVDDEIRHLFASIGG